MISTIVDSRNLGPTAPNEFSLEIYRKVLAVFYIEERMRVFARQGKCSFVASSRGHEVTQATIVSLLKPGMTGSFPITALKVLRSGLASR